MRVVMIGTWNDFWKRMFRMVLIIPEYTNPLALSITAVKKRFELEFSKENDVNRKA